MLVTDGLIERRHRPIDEGLARLVDVVAGLGAESADEMCARLVSTFDQVDDDVAVLIATLPAG